MYFYEFDLKPRVLSFILFLRLLCLLSFRVFVWAYASAAMDYRMSRVGMSLQPLTRHSQDVFIDRHFSGVLFSGDVTDKTDSDGYLSGFGVTGDWKRSALLYGQRYNPPPPGFVRVAPTNNSNASALYLGSTKGSLNCAVLAEQLVTLWNANFTPHNLPGRSETLTFNRAFANRLVNQQRECFLTAMARWKVINERAGKGLDLLSGAESGALRCPIRPYKDFLLNKWLCAQNEPFLMSIIQSATAQATDNVNIAFNKTVSSISKMNNFGKDLPRLTRELYSSLQCASHVFATSVAAVEDAHYIGLANQNFNLEYIPQAFKQLLDPTIYIKDPFQATHFFHTHYLSELQQVDQDLSNTLEVIKNWIVKVKSIINAEWVMAYTDASDVKVTLQSTLNTFKCAAAILESLRNLSAINNNKDLLELFIGRVKMTSGLAERTGTMLDCFETSALYQNPRLNYANFRQYGFLMLPFKSHGLQELTLTLYNTNEAVDPQVVSIINKQAADFLLNKSYAPSRIPPSIPTSLFPPPADPEYPVTSIAWVSVNANQTCDEGFALNLYNDSLSCMLCINGVKGVKGFKYCKGLKDSSIQKCTNKALSLTEIRDSGMENWLTSEDKIDEKALSYYIYQSFEIAIYNPQCPFVCANEMYAPVQDIDHRCVPDNFDIPYDNTDIEKYFCPTGLLGLPMQPCSLIAPGYYRTTKYDYPQQNKSCSKPPITNSRFSEAWLYFNSPGSFKTDNCGFDSLWRTSLDLHKSNVDKSALTNNSITDRSKYKTIADTFLATFPVNFSSFSGQRGLSANFDVFLTDKNVKEAIEFVKENGPTAFQIGEIMVALTITQSWNVRPIWEYYVIVEGQTVEDAKLKFWLRVNDDINSIFKYSNVSFSTPGTNYLSGTVSFKNLHFYNENQETQHLRFKFDIDFYTKLLFFGINDTVIPFACVNSNGNTSEPDPSLLKCFDSFEPYYASSFDVQNVKSDVMTYASQSIYMTTGGLAASFPKGRHINSKNKSCSASLGVCYKNYDLHNISAISYFPGKVVGTYFSASPSAAIMNLQMKDLSYYDKIKNNTQLIFNSGTIDVPPISDNTEGARPCAEGFYGPQCSMRCPLASINSTGVASNSVTKDCTCVSTRVNSKGLCLYGQPPYDVPHVTSATCINNVSCIQGSLPKKSVPPLEYGNSTSLARSGFFVAGIQCNSWNIATMDWSTLNQKLLTPDNNLYSTSIMSLPRAVPGFNGTTPGLWTDVKNAAFTIDLHSLAFFGERCIFALRVRDTPRRFDGKIQVFNGSPLLSLPSAPPVDFRYSVNLKNYSVVSPLEGRSWDSDSIALRFFNLSLGYGRFESFLSNNVDRSLWNEWMRSEAERARKRFVKAAKWSQLHVVITSDLFMSQGDPTQLKYHIPKDKRCLNCHPIFLAEHVIPLGTTQGGPKCNSPFFGAQRSTNKDASYVDLETGDVVVHLENALRKLENKQLLKQPLWVYMRLEPRVPSSASVAELRNELNDTTIATTEPFKTGEWSAITIFPKKSIPTTLMDYIESHDQAFGKTSRVSTILYVDWMYDCAKGDRRCIVAMPMKFEKKYIIYWAMAITVLTLLLITQIYLIIRTWQEIRLSKKEASLATYEKLNMFERDKKLIFTHGAAGSVHSLEKEKYLGNFRKMLMHKPIKKRNKLRIKPEKFIWAYKNIGSNTNDRREKRVLRKKHCIPKKRKLRYAKSPKLRRTVFAGSSGREGGDQFTEKQIYMYLCGLIRRRKQARLYAAVRDDFRIAYLLGVSPVPLFIEYPRYCKKIKASYKLRKQSIAEGMAKLSSKDCVHITKKMSKTVNGDKKAQLIAERPKTTSRNEPFGTADECDTNASETLCLENELQLVKYCRAKHKKAKHGKSKKHHNHNACSLVPCAKSGNAHSTALELCENDHSPYATHAMNTVWDPHAPYPFSSINSDQSEGHLTDDEISNIDEESISEQNFWGKLKTAVGDVKMKFEQVFSQSTVPSKPNSEMVMTKSICRAQKYSSFVPGEYDQGIPMKNFTESTAEDKRVRPSLSISASELTSLPKFSNKKKIMRVLNKHCNRDNLPLGKDPRFANVVAETCARGKQIASDSILQAMSFEIRSRLWDDIDANMIIPRNCEAYRGAGHVASKNNTNKKPSEIVTEYMGPCRIFDVFSVADRRVLGLRNRMQCRTARKIAYAKMMWRNVQFKSNSKRSANLGKLQGGKKLKKNALWTTYNENFKKTSNVPCKRKCYRKPYPLKKPQFLPNEPQPGGKPTIVRIKDINGDNKSIEESTQACKKQLYMGNTMPIKSCLKQNNVATGPAPCKRTLSKDYFMKKAVSASDKHVVDIPSEYLDQNFFSTKLYEMDKPIVEGCPQGISPSPLNVLESAKIDGTPEDCEAIKFNEPNKSPEVKQELGKDSNKNTSVPLPQKPLRKKRFYPGEDIFDSFDELMSIAEYVPLKEDPEDVEMRNKYATALTSPRPSIQRGSTTGSSLHSGSDLNCFESIPPNEKLNEVLNLLNNSTNSDPLPTDKTNIVIPSTESISQVASEISCTAVLAWQHHNTNQNTIDERIKSTRVPEVLPPNSAVQSRTDKKKTRLSEQFFEAKHLDRPAPKYQHNAASHASREDSPDPRYDDDWLFLKSPITSWHNDQNKSIPNSPLTELPPDPANPGRHQCSAYISPVKTSFRPPFNSPFHSAPYKKSTLERLNDNKLDESSNVGSVLDEDDRTSVRVPIPRLKLHKLQHERNEPWNTYQDSHQFTTMSHPFRSGTQAPAGISKKRHQPQFDFKEETFYRKPVPTTSSDLKCGRPADVFDNNRKQPVNKPDPEMKHLVSSTFSNASDLDGNGSGSDAGGITVDEYLRIVKWRMGNSEVQRTI